jgi:hypothetical protein
VIHLRPRPANDTQPVNNCDCCSNTAGDYPHTSEAHRDPQAALGMAVKHLSRHDEIAMDAMKRGDPDRSKRKTAIHHLNMHAQWKREAERLMAKARKAQ